MAPAPLATHQEVGPRVRPFPSAERKPEHRGACGGRNAAHVQLYRISPN